MKHALTAHGGHKAAMRSLARIPRGWIVIGAALMSWVILVGLGTAGTQLFLFVASHI
jgi:hypothetical protein